MAAVAQRSLPLQTGTAQICARPDPFQQALIVCPPGFQGKEGGPDLSPAAGQTKPHPVPAGPLPWDKALRISLRRHHWTQAPSYCGQPRNSGPWFFSPPASDLGGGLLSVNKHFVRGPIVMLYQLSGFSEELSSVWPAWRKVPPPPPHPHCQHSPRWHGEYKSARKAPPRPPPMVLQPCTHTLSP